MINKTPNNKLRALRTVNLMIWQNGSDLNSVYMKTDENYISNPMQLKLKPEELERTIFQTIDDLGYIALKPFWSSLSDPLYSSSNGILKQEFEKFTEDLISKGSELYNLLINEPELGKYISQINELPDDSSICVLTDCGFLPLEILYPLPYDKNWPNSKKDKHKIQHAKLWGNRFQIEYQRFARDKDRKSLSVKEHQNSNTFVSLNLNPTIDKSFINRPYKPIESHILFYKTRLKKKGIGEYFINGDEIKNVLLSDYRATILYLYCHGRCDYSGWTLKKEELELDVNNSLTPSFFDNTSNRFLGAPIVFLNSCSSGVRTPFSYQNFYSKFMEKRSLGVVGTILPMPASFASAFAQRLIGDYIDKKGTIAENLMRLRRELLAKGNLLGLFYILLCPLHAEIK